MTSEHWELVAKIFDAALDQPQGARQDFVRRECKGDEGLEAEVLRLLAADEQAGSFLEGPAVTAISRHTVLGHSDFPAGSIVCGRFEILRFIGQGGMGQVYEALDLELKTRIALKTIRSEVSSDQRMLSRFRREVQLTRLITHPNVCRTFDIERHSASAADGTKSDITFLTMELLEGETLANLLRRQGRFTATEALPLVLQMIQALSAAHSVGIIHRDFKPSNVLLVPSNDGLRVVVTDFGLARAILPDQQTSAEQAATSLTGSQGLIGTLVYMAPEQFERGEATAASDTYSLGLVMYEMVTGQRPFADSVPFAEAAKRIKQPAPSARILTPDLDPAWESAICKCLRVEPRERFEDVRQVAEAIASGDSVSTMRPPRLPDRLKRAKIPAQVGPHRNRPWRKAIVVIAAFALVSLSVVLLRYYQLRRDLKLAGGATVLLTDIQNRTGDPRFDGTTELIRHQLSQSPYFNLMDSGRIHDVLAQMTKPANTPLDPPTAREVALRSGAPRVIFGAVSRVGDSYVLDIDIEQPDNNPRRSREQWENHWTWNMSSANMGKEIPNAFLSAVRDGSDWIRSQVGESANDIARIDVPPQDVTTDNWDALSEFAEAEKFKAEGQTDNAIVALQSATAADPHFALAFMRLGDLLNSVSRFDEGYRAYRNALAQEQQQRLTRREKLRLEGIYALDTHDFTTSAARFKDYTVYYPKDYLGWFYRATPLMRLGKLKEAIESLKTSEGLDLSKPYPPGLLAQFDFIVENFDDAPKCIARLRELGYWQNAEFLEGELDFMQGRYQESETHFRNLADEPKESEKDKPRADQTYSSFGYSLLARLFAEMGRYDESLKALDAGIDADSKTGDLVQQADKKLDRAYINCKRHNYEACEGSAMEALKLDRSLQRSLAAATLLGQAAFEAPAPTKARLLAQVRNVEAQLPREDFKPFSDIVRARVRGEILLAQGDWSRALKQFESANQLEGVNEDKEYLARALVVASEHTSSPTEATKLKERALADYSVLALQPGLVWRWAPDYRPGYLSDSILQTAALASRLKNLDERMKSELNDLVIRRAHGDAGQKDAAEANVFIERQRH